MRYTATAEQKTTGIDNKLIEITVEIYIKNENDDSGIFTETKLQAVLEELWGVILLKMTVCGFATYFLGEYLLYPSSHFGILNIWPI